MAKSWYYAGILIMLSGLLTACQPTPDMEEIDSISQITNPPSAPASSSMQIDYHLHIASVPNLAVALPIIVNQFQQSYPNIRVTYSFASSDNIYKEVHEYKNRYDVVLADGQAMPYQLYQENYTETVQNITDDHDERDEDKDDDEQEDKPYQRLKPFTYARGQLVIYSEKYDMNVNPTIIFDENMLENKPFSVVVADMEESSYGVATKEWLINQNLYPKIEDHLLELDNFSEMIKMVYKRQADFSIASLAQVLNDSKQLTIKNMANNTSAYVILPKNSYPAILQDGIVLQPSQASEQFINYLQSAKSQEILNEAGFLPICTKTSLLPACKTG